LLDRFTSGKTYAPQMMQHIGSTLSQKKLPASYHPPPPPSTTSAPADGVKRCASCDTRKPGWDEVSPGDRGWLGDSRRWREDGPLGVAVAALLQHSVCVCVYVWEEWQGRKEAAQTGDETGNTYPLAAPPPAATWRRLLPALRSRCCGGGSACAAAAACSWRCGCARTAGWTRSPPGPRLPPRFGSAFPLSGAIGTESPYHFCRERLGTPSLSLLYIDSPTHVP